MNDSAELKAAKSARVARFFKKGVIFGLIAGILYGVYGALVLAATSSGEWATWYGYTEGAPGFGWYEAGTDAVFTNTLGTYAVPVGFVMAILILGALASGINDFFSAIWMLINGALRGRLVDLVRCFKSKPGLVMMFCALLSGPIASTAYLIALVMAGPIATPITGLCPAIGAIIGRILFKQELNARMVVGILICITATFMIGSTAFGGEEIDVMFLVGLAIALLSALCWGIEGAVAGFGTGVIDWEITITIRQITAGCISLFILTPTLFFFAGAIGLYPTMVIDALRGPLFNEGTLQLASPLLFFLVAGLAAGWSYGVWFKANSMVGAALGMALAGIYSFWVPLFSFLFCGLYLGWDGFALAPIQWVAAVVMVIGVFLIAVNPLDWFKKEKEA